MTPKEALAVLCAAFRVEQLEPETVKIYVKKLHEIDAVSRERAVNRAIETSRFFPSIAEILDYAGPKNLGHPGPEEAWALVAGVTEEDTVVWTQQMAQAWGVARGCLPDRVAARMAFVECYRRQLAEANGQPPQWRASLGWDASRRAEPILRAVQAGRLPERSAQLMLPPADWPTSWHRALPPGEPPSPETDAALRAALARVGEGT